MRGAFLTLYVLLLVIIIISYRKSEFVFWAFLTAFLISLAITVYTVVRTLKVVNKGIGLTNKGNAEEAIDFFSRALEGSTKTTKALPLAYRGMVYLRIRRFDLALRDLLESCKIAKLPLINIVNVGVVYTELKQYDKALKYFLKAVDLKPKSSIAYIHLGRFYLHTNEYERAIEDLNRAVELANGEFLGKSRNLSTAYSNLGIMYTKLKEYDKADEFLAKAIKINIKASAVVKANIYKSYAHLQKIMGNIQLSRKYALKAIEIDPYEFFSYKILAEVNLIQDNYDGFYKNFEIFLEKKVLNIDDEDIEDEVYKKVKNEEKFQLLIQNRGSENKYNDFNTAINDDEILSYDLNTKRNSKNKKIIIIGIFLLIIEIINLLMINKQPAKILTRTPARTSTVKRTSSIHKIYEQYNIDNSKVIVNSPKFKVSWNKTNVKIGEKIKFSATGIVQTAKMNSVKVLTVESYDNNLVGAYVIQSDEIKIANFKTKNNKIKSYIFIMPENEDKIYEYDFILTVIP
ncbi:tetratricopeptide repeat protein [Clostridium sp. WILCCON 0269]|uniref:Tetratricopeptide repeat protein n=1 Tax=Candidatus Clostridium eludens TaxID=3381663 RepID=A0ABW8SIL1_9CLOT